MDVYKTPESNLELPTPRPFKPIKALIYGVLVSVGLLLVVSAIELFVFALINRENLLVGANENEIAAFFANNIYFLVTDLIVSFAILYFSGTIVRKYAVGYELKFGIILSLLTLCAYLLFFGINDSGDAYPFWYTAAGIISIFVAILLGARVKS